MKEIDEAKKAKAHQDERLASQDENQASDLKKRLAPLERSKSEQHQFREMIFICVNIPFLTPLRID